MKFSFYKPFAILLLLYCSSVKYFKCLPVIPSVFVALQSRFWDVCTYTHVINNSAKYIINHHYISC